ncbi:hypothetical protein DY000_02038825 [Brassica cretica]|uniref:Uncharacterized protein n=1 Tax=Brassica cretica TaxID=69181 RepID=A0ABQ7BHX8_BRACR|nr:hypothetical protein DY000_02038825 [Brassica cretica]
MTATRSSDEIERRDRATMTPTRSNDDDKIERRQRRDRATSSSVSSLTKQRRSSDDGDIERRRGDRATTATRSSNNHNLLQSMFPLAVIKVCYNASEGSTSAAENGVLNNSGAVRVSTVSHGFVYEPYALHEKIPWWRRCQNPASTHLLRSTMIAEYVPFSSDKRYATTQVKAPPKLQKTINYLRVQGDVRVSTVSHGFVYEPYALHEKIPWWRRCLYMTSGSLRSLYSTQELAGGAVRVSTVSHGFVYEPYALHEKILWWRRCLYVTSGSLRSLYSTQELAGVSVAVLNFLQRI